MTGSIPERAARVLRDAGLGVSLTGTDRLEFMPPSPNGFPLTLILDGDHRAVYFDGWHHEDFEDDAAALQLFLIGLTSAARVTARARGNRRYWWRAEFRRGEEWRPHSHVSEIFFPFWRRRSEIVLQNDAVPVARLKAMLADIERTT